MPKKVDTYTKYCSGCGLCSSYGNIDIYENDKGFIRPKLNEENVKFCEKYCPANGEISNKLKMNFHWGEIVECNLAWSTDTNLRYQASSGGVISALSIFLLENKIVDGIIQTCVSKNNPLKTETIVSTTKEDVMMCTGSRYAISSPLLGIDKILSQDKKYAFVGKPCDVFSLKKFCEDKTNEQYASKILYYISFFCAGIPSYIANQTLLKELEISEDECTYLQYRGNGWPGITYAKNRNGENSKSIKYIESWGGILGRDLNDLCRFCVDGVGLYADIVCGDAWYPNKTGDADFDEHDGRNVVFSRTAEGQELISKVYKSGMIHLEDYDLDELKVVQQFQYSRREVLFSKLFGMKIMGKAIPYYDIRILWKCSKNISKIMKIKIMLGTIKRILKGRIN